MRLRQVFQSAKMTTKVVGTINNTDNLKKFVRGKLLEVCERVFFEFATDTSLFPYIVFSMDKARNEFINSYQLELNIWDKNASSKTVEELADELELLLDATAWRNENFTCTLDLNTRNIVDDTDKSLRRRRLLFDLSVIFKEG